MTVGELIAVLEDIDTDARVVVLVDDVERSVAEVEAISYLIGERNGEIDVRLVVA